MTQTPPTVQYVSGEAFRGDRKYLHAANWFFLALKVFGYNVLGYVLIILPVILVVALLSSL